ARRRYRRAALRGASVPRFSALRVGALARRLLSGRAHCEHRLDGLPSRLLDRRRARGFCWRIIPVVAALAHRQPLVADHCACRDEHRLPGGDRRLSLPVIAIETIDIAVVLPERAPIDAAETHALV